MILWTFEASRRHSSTHGRALTLMPKTKDAFALSYFNDEQILHTKFIDLLKAEYGNRLFDLPKSDEKFISALCDENSCDDNDIDALNEVSKLIRMYDALRNFEKRITRHIWRLERLKSEEKKTQKVSRIDNLLAKYQKVTFNVWSVIKFLIDGIRDVADYFYGTRNAFFAARLKTARKEAGLTQAQLAERIGMKQSGYAQYENNGREPSLATLTKLSDVLKKPTDWLLGVTWYDETNYQ